MTFQEAKRDIVIMSILHKKLTELDSETAKRVINSLLRMYDSEDTDTKKELKILSFCVNKLEQVSKNQGLSIIKFLVDRYFSEEEFIPSQETDDKLEKDEIFSELD